MSAAVDAKTVVEHLVKTPERRIAETIKTLREQLDLVERDVARRRYATNRLQSYPNELAEALGAYNSLVQVLESLEKK